MEEEKELLKQELIELFGSKKEAKSENFKKLIESIFQYPGKDGDPGAPGEPGKSIKGDPGEPGKSIKGDPGEPGQSIKGDPGSPGEPGKDGLGIKNINFILDEETKEIKTVKVTMTDDTVKNITPTVE